MQRDLERLRWDQGMELGDVLERLGSGTAAELLDGSDVPATIGQGLQRKMLDQVDCTRRT